MKKRVLFLLTLAMLMGFTTVVFADKSDPPKGPPDKCTTIQSGTLLAKDGSVIVIGYDDWGYNYQAHLFNGWYHNSPRPSPAYTKDTIYQAPSQTWLIMKWNDAWLSNMDCDVDGKLDRHYGFPTAIGSGAWCTNHQSGEYEGEEGETCKWNYFVKIVAAPADAEAVDGIWYNADGVEIGAVLWTSYAIIQQVENDPCAGIHGLQFISPDHAGLGGW